MPKKSSFTQIVEAIMIIAGVGLVIASAFTASSYMAILGVAAVFWGVIMIYVTPTKHVPITIMDALGNSQLDNIERLLTEFDSVEKGMYVPPRNLENIESSLIFVPKTSQTSMPAIAEGTDGLYSPRRDGLFITPPGLGLSQLFEKVAQTSFTRMDLKTLQVTLPKILVDDLEIAEKMEIINEDNMATITIQGNVFSEICEQAKDCPNAHSQIGCVLSSALACALAKATGRPITIQSETNISETKTTTIEFTLQEPDLFSETIIPEEFIQEQFIVSPPAPEIIIDKPIDTVGAAQLLPDRAAPTSTESITILDTADRSISAPAGPSTIQRHGYQEISNPKSISSPPSRDQPRKTDPESQGKQVNQVSLDLENFNKTIDEQEKRFFAELAGVRKELQKLRQLTEDEEEIPQQEQEKKNSGKEN